MNEEMEIEYKVLITEDIYNQILNDYKHQITDTYSQTNYYLNHPILNKKKYMLRIREKKNTFELTLKRPFNNHRLETNIIIDEDIKNDILNHKKVSNEIMNLLTIEGINPTEIKNQFSLTTYRTDILLLNGTLSLDKNEYLDHIDYELEFEVNNEQEGFIQFMNIIKPYSIEYTQNCDSKIKRVLAVFNS